MERPRIARKICADQRNLRLESLARKLVELVVFPPRFGDVPVRQHPSARAGKKARTENIKLHLRSLAFECKNRIAVAILKRLSLRIQSGVAEPLPALLLIERN